MDIEEYEKEEKQKRKDAELKIQKLLESVKETAAKNKGVYFWQEQERYN